MEWRIGGVGRVRLPGLPRDIAPLTRRSVSQRPITWLGVLAVAAMLAATAVATVAAVRHDRDEADARRAQVANPAIRALAGDLATSAASIEDLRAYFESSDRVTASGFERFVSSSLARQPSLEYLAWTPSGGAGTLGPALLERQPSAEGADADAARHRRGAGRHAGRARHRPPPHDGPDHAGRRPAARGHGGAGVRARGAAGHRRAAPGGPARLRERGDGAGRPERLGGGDPAGGDPPVGARRRPGGDRRRGRASRSRASSTSRAAPGPWPSPASGPTRRRCRSRWPSPACCWPGSWRCCSSSRPDGSAARAASSTASRCATT